MHTKATTWRSPLDPVHRRRAASVCHESGHAVGLTHGSDAYPEQPDFNVYLGCMRSPVPTAATTLGSVNVKEINATY